MKEDRVARILAASALTVALVALILAVWAIVLGRQYRDDVRNLGESLGAAIRARDTTPRAPLRLERPPPAIDPDPR